VPSQMAHTKNQHSRPFRRQHFEPRERGVGRGPRYEGRLVRIKPLALCQAFGVLARGIAYDRIGTWSDKHKANHRRIHYIGITVAADK
jgi:hypothetical protein